MDFSGASTTLWAIGIKALSYITAFIPPLGILGFFILENLPARMAKIAKVTVVPVFLGEIFIFYIGMGFVFALHK